MKGLPKVICMSRRMAENILTWCGHALQPTQSKESPIGTETDLGIFDSCAIDQEAP